MTWSLATLALALAAANGSPEAPEADAGVDAEVAGADVGVDAGIDGAPPTSVPTRATVVRAKSGGPPAVSVGDVRLELGLLSERPRRSGTDVLQLAPAVLQTQHGGEGHAPAMYVRGLDSGEGKDLELRVDGVPLNDISNAHSHGYADTYFLIPELISALRVTEGPFQAGQGDFAVAGTAEFELGLTRSGLTVQGEYGAFNHARLTALWRPEGQGERSFMGLTLRQGSGFGPNRSFANGSLLASHEFRISDDLKVRVLLGLSGGRFDQAGVLRADEVEAAANPRCDAAPDAQFFCFTDPNQGGAQQRHFVSVRLTQRLEQGSVQHQLFGVVRDQRLRENFTGFVTDLDAGALGLAQRGDGLELLSGGVTVGARGAWVRRSTAEGFLQGAQLELGYFGRYDDVTSRSRRLRAVDGAPYLAVFDNHLRVTNLALFAQGTLPLGQRVTLRGGVRADAFLFSVADRNRPTVDRVGARLGDDRVEAFGMMPAPRASLQVLLLPDFTWTTAVGLGSRSSDGAALSDAEFAPFGLVVSAESGLALLRQLDSVRLEARAAAFATRVERDIVFSPEQGRNQTVGVSNRLGAFGLARVTWAEHLDVLATLSYTRGHLPPPGTPWYALLDGPALPYVPRVLGRLDVVGRHTVTPLGERVELLATAGLQFIGSRPLPFERFAEPVLLLDASARVNWKWVSLGVVVDNFLDARWRQAEFNFASHFGDPDVAPSRLATRHFAAGPPRQWRVTLGLHLD